MVFIQISSLYGGLIAESDLLQTTFGWTVMSNVILMIIGLMPVIVTVSKKDQSVR